ncbi:MAG: hypothetical protein ACPKMZ_10445 [Pleomorphochaeta sp.]
MKKNLLIIFLLFTILNPIFAIDDATLYIEGLESLIDEDRAQAENSFNQLVLEFPNSEYNSKANNFLFDLNNKIDNSGIVPFYLGNLSTISYTTIKLLNLLEIEQNSLSLGLAGLTGVGLGISTSYLLSQDMPISFNLYSNILTNQIISIGNFYYLKALTYEYNLFDDENLEEKVLLSAELATINGSLFLSYYNLKDKNIPKGKAFFGLQSYAWANYYYWLSTLYFNNLDSTNTLLLAMGISDAAYFGSLPLWDKLQWSSTRSGLVSVGGIGGALIGLFTNMILEDFVTIEQKTFASIIIGSSLAGQALTTYLTRNIDYKEKSKTAFTNIITPYPIIKANSEIGIGFYKTF